MSGHAHEELDRVFERLRRLAGDPADLLLSGARSVLASSLRLEELMQAILDQAIASCGARRGFILVSADQGQYHYLAARGDRAQDLANPRELVSQRIIEQVMQSRVPVFCRDAATDPRFSRHSSVQRLAIHALICLPLCWNEQQLGAIYLDHDGAVGRFGELERAQAEDLADKTATVLGLLLTVQNYQALLESLRQEVAWLQRRALPAGALPIILGESASLRAAKDEAARAARSDGLSILLLGETGTGKELFARWIHLHSPRRDAPFFAINCATIGESLAESALFGHARGAYTGATAARKGYIEQAEGGTLFLDEIGDMPPSIQVKLLRLLERGDYFRLGEDSPRKADVRIIAATNQDLDERMAQSHFRKDLYYRLNKYCLRLPPLRERVEDILPIAEFVLSRILRPPPLLEPDAVELLLGYGWPGNVRELENVLERARVDLPPGQPISAAWLRRHLRLGAGASIPGSGVEAAPHLPYRQAFDRFERDYFGAALERHGGLPRGEMAQLLGIPLRTLHHKLRELGLRTGDA